VAEIKGHNGFSPSLFCPGRGNRAGVCVCVCVCRCVCVFEGVHVAAEISHPEALDKLLFLSLYNHTKHGHNCEACGDDLYTVICT